MEKVFEEIRRSLEENPGTRNAEVEEVEVEEVDNGVLKLNYRFTENFSQGLPDTERQIEAIEGAYRNQGLEVEAEYRAPGIYSIRGEAV